MAKTLFVIGTGTDVGKTYVTGLIVKKLREHGRKAAYFKAAMSGNDRDAQGNLIPGDALHVKTISGIEQSLATMCPYVYERAVSPHLAAQIEGNPVELSRVTQDLHSLCTVYDFVTMEGAGGILCPIRFDQTRHLLLPELIRACGMNCLLVADAGLGTINAVRLTAAFLEEQGIALRGIVFNRFEPGNLMHEDNKTMCEILTGVPVVACVRQGDTDLDLDAETLEALYKEADV